MQQRKSLSRKVKEGTVVANKMSKTVTVRVDRTTRHPQFGKVVVKEKKYYAHTDQNDIEVGVKVRIVETRPLSKLKRWRVLEVLA